VKTETEIQKEILDFYKGSTLVDAWRSPNEGKRVSGAGRVKSGIIGLADISGYVLDDGRALYTEVKKPGKFLSEDQWLFLTVANLNGALAFCARSIDDCLYYLNTYKDRMVDIPDYQSEYLEYQENYRKLK